MQEDMAMKIKRANKAGILGTIFSMVVIVLLLSKDSILAFFHFDILTHNVYISLFKEYTIMRGCGAGQ